MTASAKARELVAATIPKAIMGGKVAVVDAIERALIQAHNEAVEKAERLVGAFEERRWRTLGQGGDLAACSLPNVAAAIRALKKEPPK